MEIFDLYNLQDEVLLKSNESFYDFVEQVTGKIEADILRVQGIRNAGCLIRSKNFLGIFKLDCDEVNVLKPLACFQCTTGDFIVEQGVQLNLDNLFDALKRKHEKYTKKNQQHQRRHKSSSIDLIPSTPSININNNDSSAVQTSSVGITIPDSSNIYSFTTSKVSLNQNENYDLMVAEDGQAFKATIKCQCGSKIMSPIRSDTSSFISSNFYSHLTTQTAQRDKEELDVAPRFERFSQRPSDLFLKLFYDVICTLQHDPLGGLVLPTVIGSTGVIPLTIISTIPDIMRHYYHVIVHAQKEILFATMYWERSESANIIGKAFRDLSKRAGFENRHVIIKLMMDHPRISNAIHFHSILPPSKWSYYDIPSPEEIPNISLEVHNYHCIIMDTFHTKFLIVDRKLALLNSNNIQYRPDLEMMSHYEGDIVNSFYNTFLIAWWLPFQPNLVCLNDNASTERNFPFGFNSSTLASVKEPILILLFMSTLIIVASRSLETHTITDTLSLSVPTATKTQQSKWSFTGRMQHARLLPTASILSNGKVLVTGGFSSSMSSLRVAELYDPITGNWTQTSSMHHGRAMHTASILSNGKVLVTGGTNDDTSGMVSAELYDLATGNWTMTNGMYHARVAHTASVLPNGKVLITGGELTVDYQLNTCELYDPITENWTKTSSMHELRAMHTASVLPNGKVLVTGGTPDGDSGLDTTELYDPSTGKWTTISRMHYQRMTHTATVLINGTVLVTGSDGIKSAELYNSLTNTWTITGSMRDARAYHTASLLANGKVLVTGGTFDDYTGMNSTELYDPSTGMWTTAGNMQVNRTCHTATMLTNANVLVTSGGLTLDVASHTAELYNTSTETFTDYSSMNNLETNY